MRALPPLLSVYNTVKENRRPVFSLSLSLFFLFFIPFLYFPLAKDDRFDRQF